MSKLLLKIILASVLFIFLLAVKAQKIYYAPGNEIWQTYIPGDSSKLLYTIYLLGDIKDPLPYSENLRLLKNHISNESEQTAVVILGDILYPLGLPDSSNKRYTEAAQNLDVILNTLDSFKGEIIFIPGNHDWMRGRQDGLESVKNEEKYIEQYLDRGNIYLPDAGCPGPVEINLSQDITLIVFDSQWGFQKNEKPGADGECGFLSEDELFIQIEDILRRNKDKKVIFTTHHPLFTVGNHGGYFPASYLLFPLLEFKNWMYLPLPGFIYSGYRKFLGDKQDLAHPEYKIFKENLLEIFREYPNIIYAAGHEHNLQYIEKDSLHHIISGGGGGEGTYISRRKKKTDFAFKSAGFNKLSFYSNGNVWMEFISPDSTKEGEVVFSKMLFNKPVFDSIKKSSVLQDLDFSDSVVQVKINDIYIKRKFHCFLLGENYRELWNTTVELPVFDIDTEKGGLKILQRGGGQQTRSIRLEDKNGKQYVLRSVNKFIDKAMAENMQNTIAVDVVQDGISASHPFSAITVPSLADAAGVMHTNPKIVWVPDDPRLGIYQKDLANDVFLFEERPAGNRDDVESFQRSEDIVNTAKVIEKTQSDQDYKVDQEAVVRARLFDILINDWDRHDDQWRWASFKNDKKTIYRPVPRDRDQVYFVNEGVLMWLATRNWAMRKFQGFDYDIKDVIGLGYNARYFDRSFMNEPDLASWKSIANDIQNKVTNTVIHKAIYTLPENIYELSGTEIIDKLISRRNLLETRAEEYYRFLSKGVDVVGTKDRELFDIVRQENGNTQVTVYSLSNKKGKIKEQFYSREFVYGETQEVRLYGLSGKDSFVLNGYGRKGIKVRIIGGKGNDSIIDNSSVRGMGKKTIVYERKDKKNEIVTNGETRKILSNKKSITFYDRKQFKYNKTTPLLLVGYNIDDGIILGGGALINRYNFRDSTEHKITGNLAIRTGAFAISYEGLISSFSKTFDLTLDGTISFPRNVDNYFGLGNETTKITNDKTYYRVRFSYAWLNPMLKQTINDNFSYSFGAFYQYFKVTDTSNRFIGDIYTVLLDSTAYIPHNYIGINARYNLDTRNSEVLPQRGILWETDFLGFYSIIDEGKNFIKVKSDLSFYLSFNKDPRVVFAFRFGGATNIGENEFYHSNFLGGKTNLRGFRSNRFAGDNSFYQNTEMRIKLLNIRSYVLNGQTGIMIFNDIGRVWVNGEESKKWHDGYGAGIWLTPFDFTALTLAYSRSAEESLITFTFKFLF